MPKKSELERDIGAVRAGRVSEVTYERGGESEDRPRVNLTTKVFDAPRPALTVREINAIVRAADGRNIYLVRHRLDEETVQRITRARTRGRETEVRSLATGSWLPVLPERGDRLEVR